MDQSRSKILSEQSKILKQNSAAKDLAYAKRMDEQNFAKLKISDPTRYQEINFAKFSATYERAALNLPPRARVYFIKLDLHGKPFKFYRAAAQLSDF